MKKFASICRHNYYARWILMFGVLAGLFFSSGEGIQLLPFPISESDNSKNTATFLDWKFKSYALSIHNSSNHFPLLQTKFQKHVSQDLFDGYLIFDWSNVHGNLGSHSGLYHQEANLSHSTIFLVLQSDRAPPAT